MRHNVLIQGEMEDLEAEVRANKGRFIEETEQVNKQDYRG